MPIPSPVRRVAVDIALWYSLPSAFLLIYAGLLRQPVSAALPHLLAMSLPFALLAMTRLVL